MFQKRRLVRRVIETYAVWPNQPAVDEYDEATDDLELEEDSVDDERLEDE